MNDIVRAILDGDSERVRSVAREHPEWLSQKSESGASMLELARKKGVTRTVVALIRAGASNSDDGTDLEELFVDYVSEICHVQAAAHWLSDVEHVLWERMNSVVALDEEADPWGLSTLPQAVYADLDFLRAQVDGWAAYHRHPRVLPIAQWEELHDEWLRSRRDA